MRQFVFVYYLTTTTSQLTGAFLTDFTLLFAWDAHQLTGAGPACEQPPPSCQPPLQRWPARHSCVCVCIYLSTSTSWGSYWRNRARSHVSSRLPASGGGSTTSISRVHCFFFSPAGVPHVEGAGGGSCCREGRGSGLVNRLGEGQVRMLGLEECWRWFAHHLSTITVSC